MCLVRDFLLPLFLCLPGAADVVGFLGSAPDVLSVVAHFPLCPSMLPFVCLVCSAHGLHLPRYSPLPVSAVSVSEIEAFSP